jgi:hypothetical protein
MVYGERQQYMNCDRFWLVGCVLYWCLCESYVDRQLYRDCEIVGNLFILLVLLMMLW